MNEDRATRYHRLKRRTAVASLLAGAALLAGLLWSGGSALLRDGAVATASMLPLGIPGTVVVLYVAALTAAGEVVGLPLAFWGDFLVERRYGLSTQPFGGWLWDQAKGFGVTLALGAVAATLLYALIGRWPSAWWLPAGALFAVLIVGLTNLAPVLLLPLFYTVKPLSREPLASRLVALAERAGARILGAYEWQLGQKTIKANAALAGLGATRRILVSDTLLAAYPDEEIEVVLAHELGHHVHGDVWKSVAVETLVVVAGFFLAARLLESAGPSLDLDGPADVAGLPLLLLACAAVSLVVSPAVQALSRAHERRADRFALEITRNPQAFVSAMRRLAAQNLAEERPSKIVEWLFYSHPPLRDRILAAQAYRA